MYVSHNLNVDKEQSNYDGANHRQGDWMENILVRASGFRVPSRIQLSEHRQSLCLKWHFPTQQAHAHLGRESDQSERFPPKVRHYCRKTGWHSGKKKISPWKHRRTKIHREETKEPHNQETLAEAFMVDQWCWPKVLQEGHGTGLTLNDHKTNVSNKQTRTIECVSRCTWSSALCLTHLSKIDSYPSVHPRMWPCVLHRVVWESKPNASCTIELFCVEIGP